ncbi:MAG: hypothetical protein KAU95_01130, partial [Candidatus Aenigmarchaeota archaeon]|nr:hypothetical protein [Candidatus Aenigmarchaeota archaeon]
KEICYVHTPLNYKTSRKNLTLKINTSTYEIDTQELTKTNELEYKEHDGSVDSIASFREADKFNFSLWYLPGEIPAEVCYIRTPLNYKGEKKNLSLNVNGDCIEINKTMITKEVNTSFHNQSDSEPEFASEIKSNTKANFSLPYSNLTDKEICYVHTPLNYMNDKKTINLKINETTYEIDTQELTRTSELDYKGHDESADSLASFREADKFNFSLQYLPSEIPGEVCYIRTPLNYKGEKKNLTLKINETTYNISAGGINTTNELEYKIDDNTSEDTFCIGCGNNSGLYFTQTILNYLDDIPVETCYIKLGLCYVGNKTGDIKINGAGLSNTEYTINKSNIEVECNNSNNWSWVDTKVECSDITNNPYWIFTGSGCNISNYYRLVGDNSTSGSSEYYSVSLQSLDFNYLVRLYSNTSLLYNTTSTQVNCSELSTNTILTYNCPGCDETNYYNILQDSSTSGNTTYLKNGIWNNSGDDLMIEVYSNTSLLYNTISTSVNCSELSEGTHLTYECADCDENNYYRLMSDNSTSGNSSFYDGADWNNLDSDYMISVFTYFTSTGNYDLVNISINCSELSTNTILTYNCPECNETNYYNILQDSSTSGNTTYLKNGTWYNSGDDLMIEIYSNTSLEYDAISTLVNCSELSQGARLTYECPDCDENNY